MSLVILSFPLILVMYFTFIIWVLQMLGVKAMQIMQKYSAVFYVLLLLVLITVLAIQPDVRILPATLLPESWPAIGVGLLALLSGYTLFNAECWLSARLSSGKAQAHQTVRQQAPHWWMLPVTLLIVIIEELIWRVYLPAAISEHWTAGWLLASVVASVAFGLHHLFYGWIHVVLKSGYGFIWLLLYQMSNSVVVPMLSHLVFNLAVYFCRDNSTKLSPCPAKKAV